MTTLLATLALVLVESGWILWAANKPNPYRLRGLVGVNMIIIALFARAMMDTGLGLTNITNICYAAVVCCQCIILERHGIDAQRDTIPTVNFTLLGLFAMSSAMNLFPDVAGNKFMAIYHDVLTFSPHVMIASFSAFFLGQELGLWRPWYLVRRRHGRIAACILASWACQAIDTPIFFGVAFGKDWTPQELVDAITLGFVFKCSLAVAFLPVFYMAVSSYKIHVPDWLKIHYEESRGAILEHHSPTHSESRSRARSIPRSRAPAR